jgi:hypothetical protein
MLAMPEHRWFEMTSPHGFTDTEIAFATALSDRTAAWAHQDIGDSLFADAGSRALVATLRLADPVQNLSLVHFGVRFQGDRIRGDRVRGDLFTLPEMASPWALSAAGSVGALADAAAAWLRTVTRKPVVLYLWLRNGHPYAARYAFADTGETITQCYDEAAAPQGQTAAGLAAPDLYFRVSGDFSTAAMLGELRHGWQRRPLNGPWYE